MVRALGPVLPAAAVSSLPFTVFNTFLVQIAAAAGAGVAALGSLRGLGGLAALAVGVALAPLIDRVPKHLAAAGSLTLLGLSALLGASGDFFALAGFCLLVGAATAVLNPALSAAAADRFGDGPAAARAATLVSATQSLAAMLAAPVIALPALFWGWQGDLVAVTAIALLIAVFFLRREVDPVRSQKIGYLKTFRRLRDVPGALPLLAVAMLRTTAFMGYLSYLAAFCADRFHLQPAAFAIVWSVSGGAFFVGNLLAGRYTNTNGNPEKVLIGAIAAALAAMIAFYTTHSLPIAIAMMVVLGAGHAAAAACVVSLVVRRCGLLRGAALALNGAGMSLGVFAGAALGGLGLALGGYAGVAAALGGATALALVFAWRVRR
ncbi:MFS transporter [Lentzea tibetensis]|uniref:MFS transporter n=2 Tax=Lentzea tibetensis TaxID=2591470 RepID=A0A563F3P6_9PSEU|nr:MFS transporter [Lentzea tibetensis]